MNARCTISALKLPASKLRLTVIGYCNRPPLSCLLPVIIPCSVFASQSAIPIKAPFVFVVPVAYTTRQQNRRDTVPTVLC